MSASKKRYLRFLPRIVYFTQRSFTAKKSEDQKSLSFWSKDIPYFLTLVLSLIGFQYNYIVRSFLDRPIVEYKIDKVSADNLSKDSVRQTFVLSLENITPNKRFDTIVVACYYKKESTENHFLMDLPYPYSNSLMTIKSNSSQAQVYFTIPYFQPGDKVIDTILSKGSFDNKDDVLSTEFYSTNAVYFSQHSWSTIMVKNQVGINLTILFLLIISLLYFIIKKTFRNMSLSIKK